MLQKMGPMYELRLGLGLDELEPAVTMYEHAEGDAWEQKQSQIEKQNDNRRSGKTISDIKMKGVKPDSSTRLKIKFGNFKKEERAKNPPVPIYEPAEGKTMSEFKMKDVKPDSSRTRTVGLVTKNFKESEHGKNRPVLKKECHCSIGVTMQELDEGDAGDNDQDLIRTMSEFKMKGVKSGHGKNRGVRTKRRTTQLNLAKLGTDTLRRYISHFKIEGIPPSSSRVKMLNAVQQHFALQPPLDEQQVIPKFINAVRKNKGKT